MGGSAGDAQIPSPSNSAAGVVGLQEVGRKEWGTVKRSTPPLRLRRGKGGGEGRSCETSTSTAGDAGRPVLLILGAMGKQGEGLCKAVLEYNAGGPKESRSVGDLAGKWKRKTAAIASVAHPGFDVVAMTRFTQSDMASELKRKGVRIIRGDFRNQDSVQRAVRKTRATLVWFMTDFWGAAKQDHEIEAQQGRWVVDACAEEGSLVKFVVYSSICDCDVCDSPEFVAKLKVEEHLAASRVKYAVLRPVMLLDTYANHQNPLTKGILRGHVRPDVSCKYIAAYDLGRAALKLLMNPSWYHGEVISAATLKLKGSELAEAMFAASGAKTEYAYVMDGCFGNFCCCLLPEATSETLQFVNNVGFSARKKAFTMKYLGNKCLSAVEFFRQFRMFELPERVLFPRIQLEVESKLLESFREARSKQKEVEEARKVMLKFRKKADRSAKAGNW